MTIKEAKEIDMVEYLAQVGYYPTKIQGQNYWFSSPLHDEKTPSFKVNRKMNRWKDWGNGQAGNLVDFGILYHQCSISDFLQKLTGSLAYHPLATRQTDTADQNDDEKEKIRVLAVKPIMSLALIKYLRDRRIPDVVATKYVNEIHYTLYDKAYYALGFKNDSGGYELRNQYIKISSSPKDSTFIDNGSTDLAVFEGFFNFLSYAAIYLKLEQLNRNFLILNSTSFFEKNTAKMAEHKFVHLYLDNDKTGQKFTQLALGIDRQKFKDERPLYKNYKDLNQWLTQIGVSQKHVAKHSH